MSVSFGNVIPHYISSSAKQKLRNNLDVIDSVMKDIDDVADTLGVTNIDNDKCDIDTSLTSKVKVAKFVILHPYFRIMVYGTAPFSVILNDP